MSGFDHIADSIPARLGLSRSERTILAAALQREVARYSYVIGLLWDHDPNGGPDDPQQAVYMHASRLRRKLRCHGVRLQTSWGVGLFIESKDKTRFLKRIAA